MVYLYVLFVVCGCLEASKYNKNFSHKQTHYGSISRFGQRKKFYSFLGELLPKAR